VIVTVAILAFAAPAAALSVVPIENPGGNVLDVAVIAVPFVEEGLDIAGRIVLRETWTDPLLQSVVFGIEAVTGELGTRWVVEKLITNETGLDWFNFENELLSCTSLDPATCVQSDEFDAVDFAQGTTLPRTSTTFPSVFVDELAGRDFIQFFGATLGSPGVDVQRFFIDLGQPFVGLRQQPNAPAVPEPATLLILGAGLVGMVAIVRLRRRRGLRR
jgi:hypothetical protein